MTEEYPELDTEKHKVTADDESAWYIYPVGLMPGFVVHREVINKAIEADQRAQEKKDKNKKPPKPPSRPNARIGRTALGHGF